MRDIHKHYSDGRYMQQNGNETDLPQLSDAQDYDDWGSKGIKDRICNGKED
jgi:hypothetical protein